MDQLEAASAALRRGLLVVMPTDTVYGVGALPRAHGGVASLFEVKGRPESKPIPVLAASDEDLLEVVVFDRRAHALAELFWPGPLTLVLPRRLDWPYDLGGDAATIAVRVPRDELARSLLERTGPLAVTSANRSAQRPASTVAEARRALGEHVAVYLDGGVCSGSPSSVVSLVDELRMLREGAVSLAEIQNATE
ncbi:MAG: L-threonylcarbamoyladenylate synthase [Actinomycetota bacterium]